MSLMKKYILALLALAVLVVGLESVRSFLMKNFIEPVALVLWAAWRIIVSVDQTVYWVLLIVACFLLVIRLVPSGNDTNIKAAYTYRYKTGNRVEYWQGLLANARLGEEEAENLRDGMKKLMVSILRDAKQDESLDLREMAATGKLPLSNTAQDFLYPSKPSGRKSSRSPRLIGWLSSLVWFRKSRENVQPATVSMEEILKWMEMELEIRHDK